jgi:Na+/proline symporter
MKNVISLARILLATACPESPTLWVGSFTDPAIFGAFFWKRSTAAGAIWSIIAGGVVTGFLSFFESGPWDIGQRCYAW